MHLNLKAKFAILTGTSVLAVAVLLTTVLTLQQERTIRQELLNRAIALTENLAYNCQLPLAAENKQSLHRLAQGLFKQAEVTYVRFKNSQGTELHGEAEQGRWPADVVAVKDEVRHASGTVTAWVTAADGATYLDVQTAVVVQASTQDDDILATQQRAEDVPLGSVSVGLSTQPAQIMIARVRRLGSLLGIAVALAGSLLASTFIQIMTRPLGHLMEGNRRVARGDFSLRLEVRSGDEFGRLAGSYNQMADEIQRSRELAESYLASLRSNAEHLEEANRALQQSNAELAKASRMKSEFLAVMSHELRTPLNVIIGFSEVLHDQTFGELNPKQRRYVENVMTSGRHLLTLINDILDLSKIEAGRMKVLPEPFDLRQTLDEIQGLVRELASQKGVRVRFSPAPTLTPATDQKFFKQVMLNLLSNAIKFTKSGGTVDLTVRCLEGRQLRSDTSTRTLSPERQFAIVSRRVLLVEVKDTGVGIARDDQDRIFTAFQQVDASYSRQQQGTGLGLALTRKIVHLLGGDIWFQSNLGEGSTFWFYVPFEFQAGESHATVSTTDSGYETPLTPPARVADPVATAPSERAADPLIGGHGARDAAPEEEAIPEVWPWGRKPVLDAAAGESDGEAAVSPGAEEGIVTASSPTDAEASETSEEVIAPDPQPPEAAEPEPVVAVVAADTGASSAKPSPRSSRRTRSKRSRRANPGPPSSSSRGGEGAT